MIFVALSDTEVCDAQKSTLYKICLGIVQDMFWDSLCISYSK